jgi:hypothetical protein
MKREILQKAISLTQRSSIIFVATANRTGMPHIAKAGKVELVEGERVEITAFAAMTTLFLRYASVCKGRVRSRINLSAAKKIEDITPPRGSMGGPRITVGEVL